MAMWTHMGQVFLIRLAGDGRRVERIVVKQIAGVDFRKDEQKPQAHSWESFNVLPSSVTEFKITNDEGDDGQGRDSQYMFIGGNDGRSVLVEVEETQATAKRSGSGGATAKGDIDDIDAMLYGDTGMGAQHTLSTSKDKDASGSDGSVNPEVADGQDDSEGWQTHFRFTVHDEILGTGSIVGMDVGASALATSRSSGDEGLELVTCAGNEWRGSVRVQQRHIRPDIVASFDLPGAPVRRVWTVRCRKEYNIGGVMQAADDESLDELTDTFMILSRDASTAVFRAGDELSEVERSGFSTAVGTIDVSEILDHTRVVQVVADGIRVVNAQGKETQTIKLDVGVTVVSAQISDPYVLVKTSDGRLQLFEASTGTRKLAPVALPSTLSGVDEVAATSFFEDTHGVLTSTREWIERNPELYAEQLDESCRDGNTDEDAELDYLYTDHTQIGKRRPGAGSGSGGRQGGAKKRRHVAKGGFDDLYEDEESDDNDASEIGDEAAAQEHGWEDSYKEREGAESRTYLAVVWKGGDLSLLRLPQFDEVWRTPRFDYMAEVLAAETRGDLGAESGDDDNGDDDSGAAASAAAVPQAAAARQLDQFGVVQVGGRDLCNTLLVAVSTAGEVAVYRAFEHCARERLVQAKQATDGAAVFDQLAIRFVRVPHSVLAYEPGYEADVRKAQRRQARAFDAWQKREK
ncbi:mRNA cleavage and polyadenylation factor subunit, partial [Linderina macrospora]